MSVKKTLVNLSINTAMKLGTFEVLRQASPSVLTVLTYHRIDDASQPAFDTFIPKIEEAIQKYFPDYIISKSENKKAVGLFGNKSQ